MNVSTATAFRDALTFFRKERRMSQRTLASRSRVGEKTISSFETGARIQSLRVRDLMAILHALDVTLDEFFAQARRLEMTEKFPRRIAS